MAHELKSSAVNFEFTFVAWIARGGFGEVYRAVRKDTGEEIAVKVLREFQDPECVKRFAREIRTLMALNGKRGIIPILGYNLASEPPFYAMPLMKGGTLAAHVGELDQANSITASFAISSGTSPTCCDSCTTAAVSTATSSRRTCCSTVAACPQSGTSGSVTTRRAPSC